MTIPFLYTFRMFDCVDLIKLPLFKGIKHKFRKNGISKDAAIIADIAAALEYFSGYLFFVTTTARPWVNLLPDSLPLLNQLN